MIDLREAAAADCADRAQAVYRVRAFVCDCGKTRMPSSVVASSGHFTVYFREADTWYFADDLDPGARVRTMGSPPDAYPYVCFLERHGVPAVEPQGLAPNRVQGPPSLAKSDEEEEEDKRPESSCWIHAGGAGTGGVMPYLPKETMGTSLSPSWARRARSW